MLDGGDEIVEMLVKPRVGKAVLLNRLDAERAERCQRFFAAIHSRPALASVGEDDCADLRSALDQLRERRPAAKLEIVGVRAQRQNGFGFVHFGGAGTRRLVNRA